MDDERMLKLYRDSSVVFRLDKNSLQKENTRSEESLFDRAELAFKTILQI